MRLSKKHELGLETTFRECRALVSFGGSKEIKRGIVEAQDPVKNFNRRADNG